MWHERAETMVKLITQADGEVFAAPGDIADPDAVEHVFQQFDEHYGGIDILVNDAGVITRIYWMIRIWNAGTGSSRST